MGITYYVPECKKHPQTTYLSAMTTYLSAMITYLSAITFLQLTKYQAL